MAQHHAARRHPAWTDLPRRIGLTARRQGQDHPAKGHIAAVERRVHLRRQPTGDIPVDRFGQDMRPAHQPHAAIAQHLTLADLEPRADGRGTGDDPPALHLGTHTWRIGQAERSAAGLQYAGRGARGQQLGIEAFYRRHLRGGDGLDQGSRPAPWHSPRPQCRLRRRQPRDRHAIGPRRKRNRARFPHKRRSTPGRRHARRRYQA